MIKYCYYLFFTSALYACNSTSDKGEVLPTGMVLIPSGTFEMGGKSEQAARDEYPRRNVEISAFYMDVQEVSNRQFLAFVLATDYITVAERDIDWQEIKLQFPAGTKRPADSVLKAGSLVFHQTTGPVDLNDYNSWWQWTIGADWRHPEGPGSSVIDRMNHPVVHVAWEDAQAFAHWAGKRLPREAEWEWAAMGGLEDVKYPWGNASVEMATDKANFWQGAFPYQNYALDGFISTAPVQSFETNGYGLYDMAGNVWEWCQDRYDYQAYHQNAAKDPINDHSYADPIDPYTEKHVIRGGSYLCNDSYCSGYRVSRRMSSSKDSGFNHTGFRCVKDVE